MPRSEDTAGNPDTAAEEAARAETQPQSGDWAEARSPRLAALTLLWHPEVERVGERVVLASLSSGREVSLSRLEPAFAHPGGVSRPLLDPRLSRRPIRLRQGRTPGTVLLRRAGSSTSLRVDERNVDDEIELTAMALDAGVVILLTNRVVLLLHRVDPQADRGLPDYGLIGANDAMAQVRDDIRRVADLDVPVLLRGATGTGKELVAQAIHAAGPRAAGPFVAVNMAAIPPSLAAAELFGAVRGAFTGAERDRRGYFRRAQGGTLFLDEIGETPEELQVLLLRCLDSGEIQPIGAERTTKVDVRLVAATDADLEAAVEAGVFRGPLLYRLGGYEIHIPPLRQRRSDFGALFSHFLRRELTAIGEAHRLAVPARGARPFMPAPLVARLAGLDWPGNVRQLRNAVRQLVIASRGADEVRLRPSLSRLLDEATPPPTATGERRPGDIGEEELLDALRAHRWSVQDTARQLRISRGGLYELMERSPRVHKASDLSREEIESSRHRHGGDVEAMVDELEVSKPALRRRMKQLGFI